VREPVPQREAAQPQDAPGQCRDDAVTTPAGFTTRSLVRIALAESYGVYFQPAGGQAGARLPWHLRALQFGVQDAPAIAAGGIEPPPSDRPSSIDVAFVVDTTGGMAAELHELEESFDELVDAFRGTDGEVDVQFAVLAFRDDGEEYVTLHHDFTPDADETRQWLGQLQARGGGDVPERGDQALLESMIKLNWRAERPDRTRVIILLSDAPPHSSRARVRHGEWTYPASDEWLVKTAQTNHMRIHAVAASGMSKEGATWLQGLAKASGGSFEDLAAAAKLRDGLRRRHHLYNNPITQPELAGAQETLPPGTRRVAVLPFRNIDGQDKLNPLSDRFVDGITEALEEQPQLAVRPLRHVQRLVRSPEFRDKMLTDAPVAQSLGKSLGAELLLTGFYLDFQNKLQLRGQAIEADSGRTLGKVELVTEPDSNPVEALARSLLVEAKITAADSISLRYRQRSVAAVKDFEHAQKLADNALRYHARESVAVQNKQRALKYTHRVLETDPNFLEAYLLQADLEESMNQRGEAAETLKAGLARARVPDIVARESIRLAIEARHAYSVGRDYSTAMQLYAQILEKYPTNLHALWQLAHLSAGEWGCPPEYQNRVTAREYIAKILTLYPTSGMARYFEHAASAPIEEPPPATG
jgi:tetratricopeptide (TPR) repeat protein